MLLPHPLLPGLAEMKRLIINADDFGVSRKRNEGIVEAHLRGIVTSVSMLATGEAFEHAALLARNVPTMDVGLHLDLSDGSPLVKGHKTLVDKKGRFLGKPEARARAAKFNPREVERETEAQIAKLLKEGIRVTHIDGHQHIHVYGALAEPIGRAAKEAGLRWIRLPIDRLTPDAPLPAERAAQIEEYREHALRARETFERFGLRSPDHFGGAALSGDLTVENMLAALSRIPAELTEIMVHPGFSDGPEGFSGPDRERELQTLTDPRIRLALERLGITLTSFAA